jgi:nucleoside-diphosphate-sugar epimerase
MRAFVTGAADYVGFNVALALRCHGYDVWGLVPNRDEANRLLCHEIHPVIGTVQDPQSYAAVAESSEVLAHITANVQADTADFDIATVGHLIAAAAHGPQPKRLI